jgi:hypothetical protein
MKITEAYQPMTFDEALQNPSLSRFHEVIHYLQDTPNKDILPKKYEISMTDLAIEKTAKVFYTKPNMPFRSALTIILQDLPEDLSTALVLKITEKIIEKWENLSMNFKQQNKEVAIS